MYQRRLASAEFALNKKPTRCKVFLAKSERAAPWNRLIATAPLLRILLTGSVVGLLGACQVFKPVGPEFQTPAVQLPAAWSAPAEAQAPAPLDEGAFWAQFQDPLLQSLLAEADANNLDLASTAGQVAAAEGVLRATQGGTLPSVALGADSIYTLPDLASRLRGPPEGSTTHQVLAQSSWELDFWGKQRRAVEADAASLQSAQQRMAWARLSVRASVASVYVQWRLAQTRLAVAQSNLAQQEENARIARVRFQAGASSELDWRQAQAQLAQTAAQVPGLQSAVAQNSHALAVLIGQSPAALVARLQAGSEPRALPVEPQRWPHSAPADWLRRRPDVSQALWAAATQSARIGQAEAALYPSFSLTGALGVSGSGSAQELFSWDSRLVTAGLNFSLPLFDRGRLKAQVQVQDAVFRQALSAYQSQVLKAQQEVEDAFTLLRNSREQARLTQEAQSAAHRAAELALSRYRAGQVDFLTVSSAEQSRLQTADADAQARAGVLQAVISVYRAMGGAWPDAQASVRSASQRHTG
jgi:NodT family efflux transporter outer membrane factor (OMF) lipoprotein